MSTACSNSDAIEVSHDFESAAAENIKVDSYGNIHFSLPANPGGKERLWFYFKVSSPTPVRPKFIIENPFKAHQHNWDIVRPVFSTDRKNWVRTTDTEFSRDDSMLSKLIDKINGNKRPVFRFRSPITSKELWVAYSYPYTSVNLEHYLETIRPDKRVQISNIGQSEQGRPITLVKIEQHNTTASTLRKDIWVVCREHPGETPASYVLEGFINELLNGEDGKRLLSRYRFNIVPMINIDGVTNGYYYRNVKGIDVAQDWETFRSAEVRALHQAMRKGLESGNVALVLNLHSANEPKTHFFLKTPPERLSSKLAELQQRLIQSAYGIHPQLQIKRTVGLWDYPVIFGNYLSKHYGVYCLYLETNYNVGADKSTVTPDSLRGVGTVLDTVLFKSLL